jgi:hypothetical protein
MWTALPNGYSADGTSLRLSVLLSPRLEPQARPNALSSFFPDWEDWPATLSTATFTIAMSSGGSVSIPLTQTTGPNRVDVAVHGPADSEAWKALFSGSLFVRPYEYKDLSSNPVLSFDTLALAATIRGLYRRLAATATDDMPKVSEIVDDARWDRLAKTVAALDREGSHEGTGLRRPDHQFERFQKTGLTNEDKLVETLARFQLFHTSPLKPVTVTKERPEDHRITATWLEHERKPMPSAAELVNELDFHQIVAAMNPYPTMLRRLGLVVDFIVAPDSFTKGADVLLSCAATFPQGVLQIQPRQVSAETHIGFSATAFEAVSNPGLQPDDLRIKSGLVELSPEQFDLLQMDVDGAGLKVMNFARSLSRLKPDGQRIDPATRFEKELGAPALRTAGLMLVQRKRGELLTRRLLANKDNNTRAEQGFQGAANRPNLWAEDVVRGYRVDIWDRKTQVWRSLCERQARYDIGEGAITILPEAEEGTVRLGATRSSDKTSNPDLLFLHEALLSWTGWSLTAPPAGRAIRPDDKVDKSSATTEAEIPPGLHFKTRFKPGIGSLPRLRYGRDYWIRARAVDLAGNSLAPAEHSFGPEHPEEHARRFLRYEPVLAPVIALLGPQAGLPPAPAEGESMQRIAIRTFNDIKNDAPHEKDSWRAAVPPQATVRDAEQHGKLDAGGQLDATMFNLLANVKDRDATDSAAAVRQERIPMTGPLDPAPVETTFAVYADGASLTYLPDPLAEEVAVRVFRHPNFPSSEIIRIPLYAKDTTWPEARPFRIRVFGDETAKPWYEDGTHILHVPVPRGVRARLRLSMMLTPSSRSLLGIWHLLASDQQSPLETMSLNGQHWMLTPWRTIEVVHAVQRPLIVPEISKLSIGRWRNGTSAEPRFHASCSLKSTDRLDLRAEWHEPSDDPADADSEEVEADRSRGDTAFQVKITEPESYALKLAGEARGGYPDHLIEGEDRIFVGPGHDLAITRRHEFHDTRYRRIEYWLEGTTKFREFMTPAVLTDQIGGTAVPVDTRIKVTGPRVVTWIPSSAPPPSPQVLYIVPTFGWSRGSNQAGQPTSWRRGGGLRVYLDRPWNVSGYGEMLAVVLPPPTLSQDPEEHPKASPYKKHITQWANDPIWLSPFVSGIAPKRENFPLARTAPDPSGAWLPPNAPPTESDQPPGAFAVTNLLPPAAPAGTDAPLVDIAPHDVRYDADRRLWYCDIEVRSASYSPFIRLALARYQPTSITGVHLSNIVLADIMPLAADRWLNVTQLPEANRRRITVYGGKYTDSSGRLEASAAPSMSIPSPVGGRPETLIPARPSGTPVFEAWIEKLDESLGADFGWQRVPQPTPLIPVPIVIRPPVPTPVHRARARELAAQRDFQSMVVVGPIDPDILVQPIWQGDVTVPVFERSKRYRLVIVEYEEYLVDDTRWWDPVPTKKDRRVVFVEHIELN